MGQQQTNPYTEYQKEYALVSQNQKDELLIRHKDTGKQYMLRKIIVKSQQQLEQRLKLLNRRRKIKSEHLLNIINYKPINNDRICGNIICISLLIEYPFESLYYETIHRHSQPNIDAKALSARSSPMYFQEHQLWSILYSCVLGLETLYINDMVHQSITKSLIFVDKDGVVKIGDPILLGTRTNYDRVIEELDSEKRKHNQSSTSNRFDGQNPMISSTKINQSIDTSLIISPELISLCKDHQYYFFDKEKSDVFVMGATMIELGLLEDAASVNTKENVFKTDLSEYFRQNSKLYEKYSPSFLSIIQSMVDLDPKKRPKLSEIVQRIEQLSMEESTISEKESFKKNPNETFELPSNTAFKGYSLNQKFNIQGGNDIGKGYEGKSLESNLFQSGYLQPVSILPSVHLPMNAGANFSLSSGSQGLNYPQFPSFSIPQSNKNESKPNDMFKQSTVKSIFARQLPVEIKYAESPLIVPVSNIRLNEENVANRNYSTPFNNLNLTESNQKKVIGKTIDKESVVQNKFTLFGPNSLDPNNLFNRGQQNEQKITNNVMQRFSFHNFGRIQIANPSNQTSLNTSTLPTPRFQNPYSTIQSTIKINDVTKPLFTPTFHNFSSTNYGTNSFNPPSFAGLNNTYVQSNKSLSQNSYQNKNFSGNVNESSYDPKKHGFSVNQDFNKFKTHSVDQKLEPYFNNSSVGYTLPKYRPESAFSEIVQVKSQQKEKENQRKFSTNSVKNINNISPTKRIEESESILKQQNSATQIVPSQNNLHSNSVINSNTNITNDKIQTYSSTSTVKKEAHGSKKTQGKKYSFYKKQLDEKLQKIQEPFPIESAQIQKPLTKEYQQPEQSPFLGKQLKLSYSQNVVTQVEFEPQSHSMYVQEVKDNGCLYRGYKLNGQRHGSGTLIFADSGFYQGQFSHDQMQGFGKLYYNENDLAYEGQFKENYFHGHGILYNNRPQKLNRSFDFANLTNINNFWLKYDGYFKEDQKSGKCHIFFTNGEQFEGYCQSNTFEGKGKFKTLDGSFVEGIWRNNVLVEIQNDTQIQASNN